MLINAVVIIAKAMKMDVFRIFFIMLVYCLKFIGICHIRIHILLVYYNLLAVLYVRKNGAKLVVGGDEFLVFAVYKAKIWQSNL